ncbi:MAG: hypothetical protein IPK17_11325 [Chloroflexi bacterium]|uniref:hypothetical protein n=1 Tax=Candidatus Flexifilum breve TaxID=3140694 RepID=UPI0031356BD5|nr:hypothetical protein [Chloroflexota bacterium]
MPGRSRLMQRVDVDAMREGEANALLRAGLLTAKRNAWRGWRIGWADGRCCSR